MSKQFLPSSVLGKWAVSTLLFAVLLLAFSVTISAISRSAGDGQVMNILGPFVILFFLTSTIGIVLAWVAIGKHKDRSILLVTVAIIATFGLLFVVIGETIEAFTMGR